MSCKWLAKLVSEHEGSMERHVRICLLGSEKYRVSGSGLYSVGSSSHTMDERWGGGNLQFRA
ncbi:hypothetical protein IF1G_07329 [Cordyceps javanica]|uniref:Uncharacterized protein n=1 Tax=Cordyceps javanica TaxID=43265 RepID=A0A545UVV7_9HYPO|nr:hypothetical protein IF1G_07329 [Cordyceps javanica]